MTIYSAATWPLLQDLQETKHKSGLFSCTATYIRPAGDTSLPTQIETSIGPVDVWPDPSVNKDTSGFDRITATGYGVWDDSISEIVYDRQLGQVNAAVSLYPFCSSPGGCSYGTLYVNCGTQYGFPVGVTTTAKNVLFGTVSIRKIGADVPASPGLKIYDLTGADLTGVAQNVSEFSPTNSFFSAISPATHTGAFEMPISFVTRLSQISQNTFGSVVETSATYEISRAWVPFGDFFENAVVVNCTP